MSGTCSSSFVHFTDRLRERIDASLASYTELEGGCPDFLREAIRYSLLGPGKRLRPILVLIAAEACRGTVESVMPAACAVEMVHAYSLIHDDLPAMDDDDLRRGQQTCHKKFGEAAAILAGDALLALAFEVLAKGIRPSDLAARCCAALAHAAGASQLVGGQADDISGGSDAGEINALESIHRRKTGALILASLQLGAIVGGADQQERCALEQYGRCLGLAFQITDDLLDIRGDETALGKRTHKDSRQGKLTFPGLLGVDQSIARAEQLVMEACRALAPLEARARTLEALARYVVERNR